jgi:hypothetical protein
VEVLQPKDGAVLPISRPVVFSGTAGPTVVHVSLTADGRFPLGEADVVDGVWSVERMFSSRGTRSIVADGLDADGNKIASLEMSIVLSAGGHGVFEPPVAMRSALGGILDLVDAGTVMTPGFKGLEFMCQLPGGELFFSSDLDLDTDGKGSPGVHFESTHLPRTSLDPTGQVIASNDTPYFVLPGVFHKSHGIALGDIAAVLCGGKMEFAIFADTGPSNKIGEGSIALHRALGF